MSTPLLLFILSLTAVEVAAQATSLAYPTTAAPTATALPSAHGYNYVGCWNETVSLPNSGGARALSGGMTVSLYRRLGMVGDREAY